MAVSRCPDDALGDPRDMAKAGLLEAQSPVMRFASAGTTPETGAASCPGVNSLARASSGRGTMPNEGIQGDEWAAYVTLTRATETNVGSPTGREPYGDGVPIVVAGVTTCQGGRESRPQGEGAQVIGHFRPGGMRNAERRNGAGCPP